MTQTVTVREERPDDKADIWDVNEAALGRAGEADLVDALLPNFKVETGLKSFTT